MLGAMVVSWGRFKWLRVDNAKIVAQIAKFAALPTPAMCASKVSSLTKVLVACLFQHCHYLVST